MSTPRRAHRRRRRQTEPSSIPLYIASASILIAASSFIPGARESVDAALGNAGRYLTGTTPVPRLVIGLLVLAALPSLLPLFRLIRHPAQSYWKTYTSTVHLRVRWRWHYSAVDRSVVSIVPHCPHDDAQLDYVSSENEHVQSHSAGMLLRCPTCSRTFGPLPGPPRALLDRVQRHIRHAIATDSWHQDE